MIKKSIISSFLIFLYSTISISKEREIIDRIITIVNGEVITLGELKKEFQKLDSSGIESFYEKENQDEKKKKENILELLIQSRLLLQEANKIGLEVSDSEIEEHIKKIMESNNWSIDEFETAIKMLGFKGIDEYKNHARGELLKSQIVRIKVGSKINVSDREVDEAFQKKYGKGVEEEIKISHILFKVAPTSSQEEIEEKRKKAEEVRAMILNNEASFEELAIKYSDDGSGKRGGDVGYWRRGGLDPVFENTAFSLKVGKISDVVQSSYGFHIIKITDKRMVSIKDVDEIKARLRYEIYQEAFQKGVREWIKELKNKANIIYKF